MGDDEAWRRIDQARKSKSPTLDLSELDLVELPEEVGELSHLASLAANNNRLTQVPAAIGQLENLVSLNLDGNRLTTVPSEICLLKKLERLDVGGNVIGSLPSELGSMKSLTALFLSVNQLTSVPEAIFNIETLHSLHLTRNQLTSLPPDIGKLGQLTRLDLDGNLLRQLPPDIGRLKLLSRLDLDGNQLTGLPPEISKLSRLVTLYLTRNMLSSFPQPLFSITSLRELTLGGNAITDLPGEIGALLSLERLDLSDNLLRDLPVELAELTKVVTVAPRITSLRTSSLLIQGNQLPEELLQAADQGVPSLWAYLQSDSRTSTSGPDTQDLQSDTRDRSNLDDFIGELEFKEVVEHPEGQDLRIQVESLIGWATLVLDNGALADDPLLESRVLDDRNLLQSELTRSPTIDAVVAVPHIKRLLQTLLQTVPDETPGKRTASRLATSVGSNPQDPREAVNSGEALVGALEASRAETPAGYRSWSHWLATRLGWLGELDRTDVGLGGGALVTGSEIASLLGLAGPVGIVIGTMTAILAVVFRPRRK